MKDISIFLLLLSSLSAFASLKDVKFLAAGDFNTCMASESKIQCFGGLQYNQPRVIEGFNKIKGISVTHRTICALDEDGVWCWGDNTYGQLDVPRLQDPSLVIAGNEQVCVLDQGELRCWGMNLNIPASVTNIQQLSAGNGSVCALINHSVKCWAHNDTVPYGPRGVPLDLKNPTHLASGYSTHCVLDGDTIRCWGYNISDLGLNIPRKVHGLKELTVSGFHICVLEEGGIECWGGRIALDVPKNLKNPRNMVSGWGHTCVIDDDGVKCWGNNHKGQLNVPDDF